MDGLCTACRRERINQEGRILGTLPAVTNAILFDTTNADAVVSAMQIFPVTNPWNECISNRPVLANSDAMIAQIMTNLSAIHRKLIAVSGNELSCWCRTRRRWCRTISWIIPDESDLNGGVYPYGLYPTPTNQPIEGWPTQTGGQTLLQWQTNNDGSDRHSIAVQPGAGFILKRGRRLAGGDKLAGGQRREFQSEHKRAAAGRLDFGRRGGVPDVSGAGALRRGERGMVEHACRLVVVQIARCDHIYPATHNTDAVTHGARIFRRWASGCG